MAKIENQKILRLTDKTYNDVMPDFITEDVVEVQRAKLIYYKWVSRLMSLLTTISLAYMVCTTLVLLKLVPQIIIDAQIFVLFSDSDSYVKREYIDIRMESRQKIMENFIQQYIELRNTYIRDAEEMKKRWAWGGLVSYLSTRKLYDEFAKEYPKLQKKMDQEKSSRSVEILSLERSGGEKSRIWKVEFKTYDYTYGNTMEYSSTQDIEPKIIERYWTVQIGCRASPNRRIAYKRLINPLGFYVYSYYQSEIEN